MRARARGLLLFGFAFSSVLSSGEVLKLPPQDVKQVTESNKTKIDTGKKEIQLESVKTRGIDHGLEKRSAEVYPQTSGEPAKRKTYDVFRDLDLLQEDPEKRTRMGFTGMRGKKEFSPEDYCEKVLRANRYPSAYKRFWKTYNVLSGGKRAPMAFHGMRGKKSEEDTPEDYAHQGWLVDSGLMDDPGMFLEEEGSDDGGGGGFEKRSPYAFQGMRGKKETGYDLKRAVGFLGMRGKKATEAWEPDNSYKRVPQTSFFGMKGKKASSGFFGMRGKKALPNAFYGIKGKREPLDYDFQDFSSLNQMKESSETPSSRFRRGIVWLNNSKKAKNSFFGMRGKKSTEERSDSRFSSTFE